ncbi:MAG: PilZ domain-containing protein [Xanthobacteraceae bacterium]|jgi:hypothetical protein
MTFNLRHDLRNVINRPAWISVGDGVPLLKCTLIDLSDSGAKLALESTDDIPDRFSLWLSRDGQQSFSCRIVWCERTALGVQFSCAADAASARPQLNAAAAD